MIEVRYARRALADLREIAVWIAKDDPVRAMSFVAELRAAADRIAEFPRSHRLRTDLAPGLRVAAYERYLLVYRIIDDAIKVERVVHGARDLRAIF